MQEFRGLTLDQERALYGLHGASVTECTFSGPQDGESALKECGELTISHCLFDLRYPLWHLSDALIAECTFTEKSRAPLWYCGNTVLRGCKLDGVKAARECENMVIDGCVINSEEFGWRTRGVVLQESVLTAQYAFFGARDIKASGLEFGGKYAFQYVANAEFDFCTLRATNAFWHAKDVTVQDSILEGEYLGWYSENLTLIHCVISGTQPFVNCKNLTLIDCKLDPSCDLAFEGSTVNATIRGTVTSVKNPLHGEIVADGYGEVIRDAQARPDADCAILTRATE